MTRLFAVVAIGCTLGFVSIAAAEHVAAASTKASADRAGSAEQRAESRARKAVAPFVVENAICLRQTRRGVVCLIRHPDDAGALHCRSTVVVRGRRVRVIQSNVCFEIREVTP
jgi:hypothetical protein